jgi:Fe-S oxidoreductase
MSIKAKEITEKLDMYGCMQCGKCTAGCPVSMKSHLNIRRIIREVQATVDNSTTQTEELWDCTSCSNCTLRCPRGLEPHELIIGLRGALIETGEIPVTARDALEATFKHGNPWGRARSKRDEWTEGLAIKNLAKGDSAEILCFLCCAACYDPRIQEVAKSLVRVFSAAGVDFAILGTEESCCGSEIRRMGEAGLFEMMVEDNLKLFHERGISKIVTTSPHCFDAFRNKYNAPDIAIRHYSQMMRDLITEGKLKPAKSLDRVVTYHDPCYLGKQNGIFDEPRDVIRSIPGVKFVDFDRCREKSLCCEGGGGRMWLEGTNSGERLAQTRLKDAADMGVDIIATACPFCLLTLEDAAKTTGLADKIIIKDIAELVAESL